MGTCTSPLGEPASLDEDVEGRPAGRDANNMRRRVGEDPSDEAPRSCRALSQGAEITPDQAALPASAPARIELAHGGLGKGVPFRSTTRSTSAVLSGRRKSAAIRNEPDITVLGSDDFWESITGIPDFRSRLLRPSTVLSWLVRRRSADEVERIKREARDLYGDSDGRLDLEALANPPRIRRATPPPSS